MRWTLEGARSMLNVRAAFQSDHWRTFIDWHIENEVTQTQIATCCKMTRHKLSLVDRRIAGYTHLQTGRSFRALSRHCNRVAVLHADDMRL